MEVSRKNLYSFQHTTWCMVNQEDGHSKRKAIAVQINGEEDAAPYENRLIVLFCSAV